ncbi:unnamed protein product [Adineta steineri]|uniref:Uncharacterized protein n=1 Tax=Adineta steineri TaxID=433720 RepID=A0A819N9K0_9BILA|nr:unnamed protein product [Adineta steineri]CAF1400358.1 unnamed protein product [Adineta steineri]CAF3873632.1 unnamed protein product [Adineta steineri]CAF3991303.1 unnamed protein product [Adineta steineri]
MTSIVQQQQPSLSTISNIVENSTETSISKNDTLNTEESPSSRENFPKGLRGGGALGDILGCLCFCCALEECGII